MPLPFVITVDTEGDNLWAKPCPIETRNATCLPRFQALCERHGFRPTFLTDYEMAMSEEFRDFGKDVLRRGVGEIGMHLHAWNTPPLENGECETSWGKCLIEYPDQAMRDKIAFMTDLLEDAFGVKMRSHRAGRWAFDERYARMLVERGYTTDCSVTPGVSWRGRAGVRGGKGGADYRGFPRQAYFLDLNDIREAGESALLEVPMTTERRWERLGHMTDALMQPIPLLRKLSDRVLFPVRWCRPGERYYKGFHALIEDLEPGRMTHLEFMLHSSELMPGGSPAFPTERHIEELFEFLEAVFEQIARLCVGMTLSEFYAHVLEPSRRTAPAIA